ncbi:MAG: type I glutamate--ammonia ligase [Candidatus Aenigmatarchaeota archaeon]
MNEKIVTEEDIVSEVKREKIERVHFQFVDIVGNLKSVSVPTKTKENLENFKEYVENGLGFDGSSVEGFVRIAESDLVLKPHISTFRIFPWRINEIKEARFLCEVLRPGGFPFEGDPIYVLKNCEKRLEEKLGKGTTPNFASEIEFFLFEMKDDIAATPLKTDRYGYFDYAPLHKTTLALNKAIDYMEKLGVNVVKEHHEVSQGQYEINYKHKPALEAAIDFINYKLCVKVASYENELFASFMPKPIYGVNGSGAHTHQSIMRNGENLFFDEKDSYHLSDLARHFLAGQLKCVKEIVGITNPTVNSYKRLVVGYEAPVYICWGSRNRSALIRKPEYFPGKEKETRLEARWPDPSMNPFLGYAVMLEAGLYGIEKKLEPPQPVEEDVYHFDDSKLKKFYIETLPQSLGEAMELTRKSKIVEKALGRFVKEKVYEILKAQWDSYRKQVHPWELEKYLAL